MFCEVFFFLGGEFGLVWSGIFWERGLSLSINQRGSVPAASLLVLDSLPD